MSKPEFFFEEEIAVRVPLEAEVYESIKPFTDEDHWHEHIHLPLVKMGVSKNSIEFDGIAPVVAFKFTKGDTDVATIVKNVKDYLAELGKTRLKTYWNYRMDSTVRPKAGLEIAHDGFAVLLARASPLNGQSIKVGANGADIKGVYGCVLLSDRLVKALGAGPQKVAIGSGDLDFNHLWFANPENAIAVDKAMKDSPNRTVEVTLHNTTTHSEDICVRITGKSLSVFLTIRREELEKRGVFICHVVTCSPNGNERLFNTKGEALEFMKKHSDYKFKFCIPDLRVYDNSIIPVRELAFYNIDYRAIQTAASALEDVLFDETVGSAAALSEIQVEALDYLKDMLKDEMITSKKINLALIGEYL